MLVGGFFNGILPQKIIEDLFIFVLNGSGIFGEVSGEEWGGGGCDPRSFFDHQTSSACWEPYMY